MACSARHTLILALHRFTTSLEVDGLVAGNRISAFVMAPDFRTQTQPTRVEAKSNRRWRWRWRWRLPGQAGSRGEPQRGMPIYLPKDPCKKEACDIQACLIKKNFVSQRCVEFIKRLQSCCEKYEYKSTHCGQVSELLKMSSK